MNGRKNHCNRVLSSNLFALLRVCYKDLQVSFTSLSKACRHSSIPTSDNSSWKTMTTGQAGGPWKICEGQSTMKAGHRGLCWTSILGLFLSHRRSILKGMSLPATARSHLSNALYHATGTFFIVTINHVTRGSTHAPRSRGCEPHQQRYDE